MKDLSVVIVNWNTKDLLMDCLTSVFTHTKNLDFEVWVVDNGSTDGSVEMLKEKFPQVQVIKNTQNLGFAKANNQALRRSKSEFVVLLNSDTKLTENTFSQMRAFAKSKRDIGVVGCKLLNRDGTDQPSAAPFYTLPVIFLMLTGFDRFLRRAYQHTREVDWVMGACMLVSKEAVQKAGLLDELFFMYVEEAEWCYRIKKAGFSVWYYPNTSIFHLTRGSSTAGKKHAIVQIFWGLQYWYKKHGNAFSLATIRLMLMTKAVFALFVGVILQRKYLIETYKDALKSVVSWKYLRQ